MLGCVRVRVVLCPPYPERQMPAGQAGSRPPACASESSGPECHTLAPGRAPWEPCGPGRNRLTCRALSRSHLMKEQRRIKLENHQNGITNHSRDQNKSLVPHPHVPLLTMGIFGGMLMIPTRSTVGTRERRMARIRSASPFPALMSWKREYPSESQVCP